MVEKKTPYQKLMANPSNFLFNYSFLSDIQLVCKDGIPWRNIGVVNGIR